MNFAKLTLATAALAFAGGAIAASDGTPGPDSTGTSVVTVIKQDAVQITKVNDLNFKQPRLPVQRHPPGRRRLRVLDHDQLQRHADLGPTAPTTSELTNGAGDVLPYTVAWGEDTTLAPLGSGTGITGGTALAAQVGNDTDLDCASDAGGVNAAFAVQIDAGAYNAAPVGTYTDILTMVVAPE